MAIYSYKCTDCNNTFEAEATIQEKEEKNSEQFNCPRCHSKKTKYIFLPLDFLKNVINGDRHKKDHCAGEKTCGLDCKLKNKDNNTEKQDDKHACCG